MLNGGTTWGLLCALLLVSTNGLANEDRQGEDHPLLSRYPGAYIFRYLQSEYDRAAVITGPMTRNEERKQILALKVVEGKVTNIQYRIKGTEASLLQIFKNYERALQRLNASVSYSCLGQDCHPDATSGRVLTNQVDRTDSVLKGVRAGGGQEVAVITAESTAATFMVVIGEDDVNKRRTISLSVIEPSSLDADKLEIGSVDEIRDSIIKTGRIVLDGVYFDHDKAAIKEESTAVLALLAEYLNERPTQRYFVVGHTDTTGDYKYNLDLSSRRAAAVKAALVEQHSVAPEQLSTVGIGPVAPEASNRNEVGRAMNRRVELVEAS